MKDNKVNIFYSYSHKDEKLREDLETHLAIMKRQELIEEWHDRKITPGIDWESEIDINLKKADIVILLVSSDFIGSDYCYGKELELAFKRHESGQAYIVPVIIRPCDWHETPFEKIQALPKDGKPVTTWPNHDEAWLDVVKGLRSTVEKIKVARTNVSKWEEPVNVKGLVREEFLRIETIYDTPGNVSGLPTGFLDIDRATDGFHNSDII